MATEILYKGRLPRSGHFSRVNFTNLMNYSLATGVIRYEQDFGVAELNHAGCFHLEEFSKSLYNKNAYHIKGGVIILESIKRRTPRHPYRRFVGMRGHVESVREVKAALKHVMDTVDYNNAPIPGNDRWLHFPSTAS